MVRSFILISCLLAGFPLLAQIMPSSEEDVSESLNKKSYSPDAGRNFPTRVYWCDTHLHTDISMDTGAFGNRLGLDEAYHFARGEQVTASGGMTAKLSRPLDWLVVADHSDNMGFFPDLYAGAPPNPLQTAYNQKYFNHQVADEVPMTTQKRAYTSPIWYTPN